MAPEEYYRPLTTAELQARFRADCFEPTEVPAGAQAQLLVRLLRLYDQNGLLPTRPPRRLCDCCQHREDRWSGGQDLQPEAVQR
jgi:hypothetical protein